jgi:serine/threonine protein kinase
LKEKAAFTTLIKNGYSLPHVVEYLGSYEQEDVRCIILEYADIGSLDDYFAKVDPPKSEQDIVNFFISLFGLIKGLHSIHEVGEKLIG